MIALLGGSGFVGGKFASFLRQNDVDYCCLGRRQLNYYDGDQLFEALSSLRPAFVINCAGFTGRPNVDACEIQKTECLAANAILPGKVAQVCDRLGIAWGHVSSGCIYTGAAPSGEGFSEVDPPNFTFRQNNCSFYSGTKALGEEILADYENCYIWRLRIPFDQIDSPRNYVSKLICYKRLLEARNSLTYLDEFVRACYDCWIHRLPLGIYNLTNTGSVTTTEVVELIKKNRLADREFSFFRDENEFMRLAARTPRSNCVLTNAKALSLGLKLSPVTDVLDRCMRDWRPSDTQAETEVAYLKAS